MAPTVNCSRRSTAPKSLVTVLEPRENTLKLPAKFCRRYGRSLPDRVSLKVAGVAVSQVGLVRRNGETFLSEGFEEFKRRYSLDFGSLLVFKYNGASQFDVGIFGLSGSEILYPFDRVPNAEEPGRTGANPSPARGVKRKGKNLGSAPGCSKVKLEPSSSEEQEKRRAEKATTPYEKAESFTRANKSSLNPSFISELRTSYIKGCAMHISATFAREFLPCTPSILTLRLMNGKPWRVKYSVGKSYANIYGGWKDFVRDNGLKVGDACVFEVADRLVWNVVIFRK